MAASRALGSRAISRFVATQEERPSRSTTSPSRNLWNDTKVDREFFPKSITRRDALSLFVVPIGACTLIPPAGARERRNRKVIPPEDYLTSRQSFSLFLSYILSLRGLKYFPAADGLKYYDLLEGNGPVAEVGATVQVNTLLEHQSNGKNTKNSFLNDCFSRSISIAFIEESPQYPAENPRF